MQTQFNAKEEFDVVDRERRAKQVIQARKNNKNNQVDHFANKSAKED